MYGVSRSVGEDKKRRCAVSERSEPFEAHGGVTRLCCPSAPKNEDEENQEKNGSQNDLPLFHSVFKGFLLLTGSSACRAGLLRHDG